MEKQYRLAFKGELLAGFEPAQVRARAAQRLGANERQLARLFSGQPVILKRGLNIDAAARYARELRQLGMRMHVEADGAMPPPAPLAARVRYSIAFSGETLPGFVREEVVLAASERLHASAEQLAILFSGRKAVLKRGLDAEGARRYASRLQNIGMRVVVEPEAAAASATSDAAAHAPVEPAAPSAPAPVVAPLVSPAPAQPERVPDKLVETQVQTPLMRASELLHYASGPSPVDLEFTQTMVDHELIATDAQGALPDLEKTELAGEAALQAYLRGEPLPQAAGEAAATTPPPVQPVQPMSSIPAAPVVPVAVALQAEVPIQVTGVATAPARICVSCGARQPQGRYCIHCGHEFAREPRPPLTVMNVPAAPMGEPVTHVHEPAYVSAAALAAPRRAAGRARLAAFLALLGITVGLLVWWSAQ